MRSILTKERTTFVCDVDVRRSGVEHVVGGKLAASPNRRKP
jgi:hypothetical protein